MPKPIRFLLALLSGALAVLAFPPVSWSPMIFIAWPILFFAIRGAGFRDGTRLGFVHGMAFFGIGASWLFNIFGTVAIALWGVLALFTALTCGAIGWVSKLHPRAWWLPLYATAAWVAVEYFRCEWFWLRFPWFTPGVAYGPNILSPILGVYGTSFLLILVIACFVFEQERKTRIWPVVLVAVILLGSKQWTMRPPGSIPVLAIQSENCDLVSYLEASKAQSFQNGIIVWPEYSVPYEVTEQDRQWPLLTDLARDKDAVLVFGTRKELPENKHYNIARTLDGSGEIGWHAKNRPVHLMDDGVAGTETVPVQTRFGALGTTVCFDNDYTEVARRMTLAGAEAFVVPSMDAGPWTKRQHLQHAELVRLRAAENARWFVVASTSGVSQIVSPDGQVVKTLPLMEDGILEGKIDLNRHLTFFTRFGWVFPWIVFGAAIVATSFLVIRRPGRKPDTTA
jgi:apolipoprotein N-acyltransferase